MKTPSLITASLLSLSLSAGLVGCAQDDDLTQEDYDDMAAAMAGLVVTPGGGGEIGSMADSSLMVSGQSASASADGASYTEIVIRAGLEYEYLVDCFDAAGTVQELCDSTTDTAEVSVNWNGAIDTISYDASVTRSGSWTMSGMQGDTAELNGEGSFDVESSFTSIFRPVERSMTLSYDAQYQGVQIDTATHRAIGGTVNYSIQGTRSVERRSNSRGSDFSANAELTIQDDSSAILVIDKSFSYELNLNTGVLTSVEVVVE